MELQKKKRHAKKKNGIGKKKVLDKIVWEQRVLEKKWVL